MQTLVSGETVYVMGRNKSNYDTHFTIKGYPLIIMKAETFHVQVRQLSSCQSILLWKVYAKLLHTQLKVFSILMSQPVCYNLQNLCQRLDCSLKLTFCTKPILLKRCTILTSIVKYIFLIVDIKNLET